MYDLRPFQSLNKFQLKQQFRSNRAVLYQAGTGSGKTVTGCSIVNDAVAKGTNVWWMAHRRELIEQAHMTLYNYGTRSGIIMAGHRLNRHLPVQVCSIDTVRERILKRDTIAVLNPPKLIVIDEAHRSLSKTYRDLIAKYPDAYILGLTATPVRADGRGLGHIYDAMVQAPPISELIEMGFLVQPRYFTGATADMTGVAIHKNDFARMEMEARMNNAKLRGDVVENWIRHNPERRKSIVFASGVKHSMALRDDFLAAGVRAVHIDGKVIDSERDQIMRDFRNTNKYEVMCNFGIVTEGTDVPEVGCISMAFHTKIITKYHQTGGRGLRTAPGKTDCIIIDHGQNWTRHGFLEDPVPWALDTEGRIQDEIPKVREKMVQQFECEACGCVFSGRVRCPECGTRLELHGQHEFITSVEELIEITRGAAGVKAADKQKTYTTAQKMNFYAQVMGYAKGMNTHHRTRKPTWVAHTYRAKFGEWPDGLPFIEPAKPEAAVLAFIKAKDAAYHIRKHHREQRA